jgi:hypothetical protein
MASKIVTKPSSNKELIDKSRDVTGIYKWGRTSRFVNFVTGFLGWFTIPFEVFFRRDFGQRWFTRLNFWAGFFLIIIFTLLQWLVDRYSPEVQKFLMDFSKAVHPSQKDELLTDIDPTVYMLGIALLYLLMGLYHLFKINWRNQANMSLHSFDNGTSRLEWFSYGLQWLINIIAVPFLAIYFLLIPRKQRKGKPFPRLITDTTAFTNTILEPTALFFLWWSTSSVISIWFLLSGVAMLQHSQLVESARKNKILDFRDGKIEAEAIRELKNSILQNNALEKKKRKTPAQVTTQVIPHQSIRYANLSTIIEELHNSKNVNGKKSPH